jgi:hypothetical protein
MSFDQAYDELVERISDRVVEKLGGAQPPERVEPWKLLNLEEAAQRLGRSERWVRERVKDGTLAVVRLDSAALAFELHDLRAFAQARRIGGSELGVDSAWWRETN